MTILALSSKEAAVIEASKLIMWLRQFLTELGCGTNTPTILYEDYKSARHVVFNGNNIGRR